MMMGDEAKIDWSRRMRPRKEDQGHSARRYGRTYDRRRMVERTYTECECGKVYSGWGADGGLNGHRRHQRNEAAKA